jgi:hypothetical protein
VGIFGPLSRAYTQILDHHNRWDGKWIDKASFIEYYVKARKAAITPENIKAAFQATGIHPYAPTIPLQKLRPLTPPSRITIPTQGYGPVAIDLQGRDSKTLTQVKDLVHQSLTGTPARELEGVVETLFTTNAMLSKANAEFITNVRKPKSKKKFITTARWLTKFDAQELRDKQLAKDNAERDRKIALANKNADTAIRKAQQALGKAERQESKLATKELRSVFERLAKIHKNYYK